MKPFSIGPWREERRLVEWTFDITHVTSTSVLVMKTSYLIDETIFDRTLERGEKACGVDI